MRATPRLRPPRDCPAASRTARVAPGACAVASARPRLHCRARRCSCRGGARTRHGTRDARKASGSTTSPAPWLASCRSTSATSHCTECSTSTNAAQGSGRCGRALRAQRERPRTSIARRRPWTPPPTRAESATSARGVATPAQSPTQRSRSGGCSDAPVLCRRWRCGASACAMDQQSGSRRRRLAHAPTRGATKRSRFADQWPAPTPRTARASRCRQPPPRPPASSAVWLL